ncbi:hypothetical protein RV06_GL001227 [Enterococcus haemoperoxidus]|nr:hypothetical protein RV06_GL001227 [Enterococcus haemoperoxidus]
MAINLKKKALFTPISYFTQIEISFHFKLVAFSSVFPL